MSMWLLLPLLVLHSNTARGGGLGNDMLPLTDWQSLSLSLCEVPVCLKGKANCVPCGTKQERKGKNWRCSYRLCCCDQERRLRYVNHIAQFWHPCKPNQTRLKMLNVERKIAWSSCQRLQGVLPPSSSQNLLHHHMGQTDERVLTRSHSGYFKYISVHWASGDTNEV